jgi:myo-inositol-1(or 4)-monophosphatase
MKRFTIELTRRVGKSLLKNFRKDYSLLSIRGVAKEIATKYDKMSDELIVKALTKKTPSYNIMAEESGFKDNKSEYTWFVDSLDGSSNFAVGNPLFAISIALLNNNKPILGVAHAPFLKETFVAEEGKGTLLNGGIVHVSDIKNLERSYILTCEGKAKDNVRISRVNSILHPKTKDLRKLGAAALECGWVSCGRADAYLTTEIDPWDVAAGVLFVEEAGGKVTDFNGKKWKPVKTDFFMSNSKIHDKILRMINK